MRFTKPIITIVACLFLALVVWADSGELYTSGKLSSSLIYTLAQDKHGYVWVGTEYGLNKFDGYRFTQYLHDEKDSTTITDNIISGFLVDKKGNLWVGSAKGLMRYDYERNNFRRYRFPDGRHPRIYSIIENHKGDILLGTAGFGLYSIRHGKDVIIREKQYAERDSDEFFTHIYEDSRHYLWQGSHLPQFTRFIEKDGKVLRKNFTSPCGAPVKFIPHGKDAMLIVCMYGIISYDYRTQCIADAGYDFGFFKGNITISSAHVAHDGNLYMGTYEHGVLVIRRGTNKVRQLENTNASFNLGSAYVNDLFVDKDRNLWVGCYKKGLYLINQQEEAFNTWSFASQNYVIGSSVSSIAAGDNGLTWCTVQNSGVYCFDQEGKIVSHPTSPAGTTLIYRDKRGYYWVGNGNALYSYNPYTGAYEQKLNFSSAGIYCMTGDDHGNLYISVYSKGLYIYNAMTGSVKVFNMWQKSDKGFLCNDWVRNMMLDHKGLLWIGTSNGVACMDTRSYAFNTKGWNTILPNKQTNAFCEGKEGNVIIGTDEGLYLYLNKENKAVDFPNSEALRGKQISSIVRDREGDLWISTTMGIWQYDKDKQRFIGHINGNGLRAKEYAHGAMMHKADDLIGFGTDDGITIFYPQVVKANKNALGNVHLTNFIVDGKSINCLTDRFSIPYSQNSFTLEFSLLTYRNTDNISFQYRINNGKWLSTGEGSNSISFTKLKPGSYTLEVRATSNGNYSAGITVIHILVKDPWYASTWAYILYFLLVAGLITYFIWSYERKRKADLDETKMRFLINATHDIRSPLTLIMGPLNKLKARLTSTEDKQDLDTIDRNAQRLLLLVNQILDERKIDKNQMQLHCQPTNLVDFIRGIMALYAFNAQERRITVTLRKADGMEENDAVEAWIDRINFDKVVSNILSNAMKYNTDDGEINIVVGKTEKSAVIKVMDTGIGFKEENTERLFERFYQGKNRDFHIEGTGIGLNLSRAIVHLHGGNIKAYNRQDGKQGACLEVSLPLGNKHLKPEQVMTEEETAPTAHIGKKKQASRNFRILVVDDDVEIAEYIKAELGDWYRFETAGNGNEGLKKLLAGKFDIVISDVMMPEMDGITFLKRIKANSNVSDIPVILLTSKSEVDNRLEGLRKGADAYLAKPFNMEELHILIDNLVDNVRRIRGKYSGAQGQAEKIGQIEVKGNDDVLMDRIIKCINDHLADPEFNVERLTEEVGISRAQLHRKMKEIAGVSSGEFIRNLRLEQAARLITEGKVNVTQVAYSVGFNNQTHFSTVFKKHFGMSPTEYADSKRQQS